LEERSEIVIVRTDIGDIGSWSNNDLDCIIETGWESSGDIPKV
jgi:hypothetical protein